MGVQFRCSLVLLNFVVLLVRVKRSDDICFPGCALLGLDASAAFAVGSPQVSCVNRSNLVLSILLLMCGDILPNPGPARVKYPCTVCCKSVLHSQRGIECSRCERWTHALCAKVSNAEYTVLSDDDTIVWHCPDCVVVTTELPFADCSFSTSMSDTSVDTDDVHATSPASLHQPLLCTCFNARSIVNKRLDLYAMINATAPDVVVITETFLDCSIMNSEIFPQNYCLFRRDRNRHGGGVLIAVSDKFPVVRLLHFEPADAELLWVRIFLGSTSIILGGFYRPPASAESCLLELQSSLHRLPPNSQIFVCGDFNVSNVSWDTFSPIIDDKCAALLCSIAQDFALEQCVRSPTRGSNVLDLLFTNCPSAVSHVDVVDNLPHTDHDSVIFSLNLLPPRQEGVRRILYNYKKADFDIFRDTLRKAPWDLATSDSVDDWWCHWKDLFFAVVDDTIPQVRWRRSKMKCWLTLSTLRLIRAKRLCYRRMKSNPALWSRYKLLRNKVRTMTRTDYKNYVDTITGNFYHSQKSFWNWINKLKACRSPIPPLVHNDSVITSDSDKAALFNDYFVSVFTAEHIVDLKELHCHLPSRAFHLDTIVVSPSEVFEELSTLDPHKACGPDQICPRLLREGAEIIASPLAQLFNKSLSDGLLPQDWVSANITPVFKKVDKQQASNYRPISLTCILCKVLEKIIHRQLYALLESNHVLFDSQYGFRIKRSTTALLVMAINDWAEALNKRLSTHCVFIDFAKAFDSVPHERLLLKLQAYGICGSLLKWFRSFLTTRKQRVVVNGCYSDWSDVSSGVPQGSILGPLLFIMYINDISSVVQSSIKMFADDVTLYTTVKTPEDCKQLQNDLNSVAGWCDRWQMKLHPLKCVLLCISNKRVPPKFDYIINGSHLDWHTSIRYLGVHITSTLSWNVHCSNIAAKATRVLFFAILCTAVQEIQSIDPSKHLFYLFLNMLVRLGTLIHRNVLSSWNPFSVVALSGFVGHSTILPILPGRHHHHNVVLD